MTGDTSTVKLKSIKVTPVNENWSEYLLADGTTIKVRPLVLDVEQQLGQKSPTGDPVYQIKSGLVIEVKAKPKAVKAKPTKKVTKKK